MFNIILKKLRTEAGLKPVELARKTDYTLNYIVGLEGKFRPPPLDTCEKLSSAMSLTREKRLELLLSAIEGRMDKKDLELIKESRRLMLSVGAKCPVCGEKPSTRKEKHD
jgi:transcriptional regulator with XRE-family HTH domain